MIAARAPRDNPRTTRLLHVDPHRGVVESRCVGHLRDLLVRGDLLVVNDAATLPASLRGHAASGAPIEVRLAGEGEDGSWQAVLFGAGDWRTRTELRAPPPRVGVGDRLRLGMLSAVVFEVDSRAPRLVRIVFDAPPDPLWHALYRDGQPIQYAYLSRALRLWDVQTPFAERPWSVEAPSAGLVLSWDLLLDLRRAGVALARVTHAAGLSSTGDADLDARLPLPERYEISPETVTAVEAAKRRRGRVIALGTTVTRALEGAAIHGGGALVAGRRTTDLHLGPDTPRAVVDGIITGVHDVASSHLRLLEAFAPRRILEQALALAEARGYQGHEFGDAMAVLPA